MAGRIIIDMQRAINGLQCKEVTAGFQKPGTYDITVTAQVQLARHC